MVSMPVLTKRPSFCPRYREANHNFPCSSFAPSFCKIRRYFDLDMTGDLLTMCLRGIRSRCHRDCVLHVQGTPENWGLLVGIIGHDGMCIQHPTWSSRVSSPTPDTLGINRKIIYRKKSITPLQLSEFHLVYIHPLRLSLGYHHFVHEEVSRKFHHLLRV